MSFGSLQKRLNYQFRDEGLLRLALTHPSVAQEQGSAIRHNQRLEFLGDAVLQLVLTQVLYERFPNVSEGPLTKARAHLVNRAALAGQSHRLGLGDDLIVSRGEEVHGGRRRPSTLADAFEALLAAIFLDGGFEAAKVFILERFQQEMGEIQAIPNLENPKGDLQEIIQSDSNDSPRYQLISVAGPDHDRIFETAVFHGDRELGRGAGKSKKESECRAAMEAVALLRASAGASEGAETPPATPS